MDARFDIFLLGTLKPAAEVAPRLAAEFGIPVERARALIDGAPVRIKGNASLDEARRYESALSAAGARAERRQIGADDGGLVLDDDPRALAPQASSAASVAPAPAIAETLPPPALPPAAEPRSPSGTVPAPRGLLGAPPAPLDQASAIGQRSRIRNTGLGGLFALLVIAGAIGLLYVKCRAPRMGGLVVERVGDAGEGRPALILLHGYGAPGSDLIRLGEEILETHPDIQIIVPEGPYDAGIGHAWYVKDLGEADSSRTKLLSLIQTLIEQGTLPESIIIAGFSQGGIMAMDAALNMPDDLGGVAMLSGSNETEFGWDALLQTSSRTRIFISHGKRDNVLGYRSVERFAGTLEAQNYAVELILFEGGHAIPKQVRVALAAFISTVVGE